MSGNLEDMRAYARGYEDGRRSKDADHAALALRLSRLRFDGGSHENLHKIAYAVYPCATGWTCESAKGLRDRLIDLLGGVHEHRCDSGRGCACGDSSAGGYGELAEAVTYDVLGNERHEAVCELRKIPDTGSSGATYQHIENMIQAALGVDDELIDTYMGLDRMRDRLIHLLGGDQPAESFGSYISRKSVDAMSSRAEGQSQDDTHMHINLKANTYAYQILELADALGVSYEVGTSVSDIGNAVIARARQLTDECNFSTPENDMDAEDAKPNPAETSEDASDHVSFGTPSITDEFREAIETATKTYEGSWYEMDDADHTICHITEGELTRIADRIDEQLNRICQQQEAVLQSTIDTMVDEREELQRELEYTKKSLDGMREQRERWADEAIEMFRVFFPHDEYCVPNSPSKMVIPKINEMQKKLDELEKFDHDTSLAAFGDDNDELRKLLSRAAKLLDNAEQDRDANYANWMDCKAKVVQANATIDELQAKLEEADAAIANWREREMSFDESEHERDELKAKTDAIREALDGDH